MDQRRAHAGSRHRQARLHRDPAGGGTGIGYFVWNEWNNLSITNVIIAILTIGVVGMLLDQILARFTRMVTFPE